MVYITRDTNMKENDKTLNIHLTLYHYLTML